MGYKRELVYTAHDAHEFVQTRVAMNEFLTERYGIEIRQKQEVALRWDVLQQTDPAPHLPNSSAVKQAAMRATGNSGLPALLFTGYSYAECLKWVLERWMTPETTGTSG
jgi:hypothetical protein